MFPLFFHHCNWDDHDPVDIKFHVRHIVPYDIYIYIIYYILNTHAMCMCTRTYVCNYICLYVLYIHVRGAGTFRGDFAGDSRGHIQGVGWNMTTKYDILKYLKHIEM